MHKRITRRRALEGIGVAGASLMLPRGTGTTGSAWLDSDGQGQPIVIGGQPVALRLAAISDNTIRFSVLPQNSADAVLNRDGALVDVSEQRRTIAGGAPMRIGQLSVSISISPLVVRIADPGDRPVQEISVDDAGAVHFLIGDAPLLGRCDAEWTGRLSAPDARRPHARAMADRDGRLGTVHSPAARHVRSVGIKG